MAAQRTLLVTLTGRDRPGVTSALFSAVEPYGVEVIDVEQVVIQGVVLGVLLTAGDDDADDAARGPRRRTELDMEVDVVAGSGDAAPRDTGRCT